MLFLQISSILAILFVILFCFKKIIFTHKGILLIREFMPFRKLKFSVIQYEKISSIKVVHLNMQRRVAYVIVNYKSRWLIFKLFNLDMIRYYKIQDLTELVEMSNKARIDIKIKIDLRFSSEIQFIKKLMNHNV